MTKEELIARLCDIEWDDFEVKAAKSELPKNIWQTVSAFSNCSGGWIVLGVSQQGKTFEITGVGNIEKLEQDFFSILRSKKFNVQLFATPHRFEIDGKNILAFYLPSSETKPVYFNSPENTFIRMGSGDQRATQPEVMAMFRDQSFGVQSQKPIEGTSITMLSQESLRDFRGEVRYHGLVPQLDNVDDAEFCREVGITDNEGRLTYGGLIVLGKSPYTFNYVPTFCADYVEIPGTGEKTFTTNYTYRIPEQQNLWDAARIISRRLRTLVNTPMVGINASGQSVEDLSEYNILREAMANQMAHADHFSPQRSCIHVFDDRIEFSNPGGMPKPVADMERSFDSHPRNPIISKLFRLAKLSENLGYGLHKLLSWKNVTGRDVHIESTFDSTKVVFNLAQNVNNDSVNDNVNDNVNDSVNDNVNDSVKLSDFELTILKVIARHPDVTYQKLMTDYSKSESTISRTIKNLKQKDLIVRQGTDKTGLWQLTETGKSIIA